MASASVAARDAQGCRRPGTSRLLPPHTLSVGMLGVVQIATLPAHEAVDALLNVRRSDKRHSVGRLTPSRGALRAAREDEMLSVCSSTTTPSLSLRLFCSESCLPENDVSWTSSTPSCRGPSCEGDVTVVTPVTSEPLVEV